MDEPLQVVLPHFNQSSIASLFFLYSKKKSQTEESVTRTMAHKGNPFLSYGGTRGMDRARLSFHLLPCMDFFYCSSHIHPCFSSCFIFLFFSLYPSSLPMSRSFFDPLKNLPRLCVVGQKNIYEKNKKKGSEKGNLKEEPRTRPNKQKKN